jgi:hypothetical protein
VRLIETVHAKETIENLGWSEKTREENYLRRAESIGRPLSEESLIIAAVSRCAVPAQRARAWIVVAWRWHRRSAAGNAARA